MCVKAGSLTVGPLPVLVTAFATQDVRPRVSVGHLYVLDDLFPAVLAGVRIIWHV